ncbi:MAG: hypothetical protein IJ871_06345 [Ruminococcus sp.]|nr:hypothetical protein [Ruminococcus sp.]
MLRTNLSDLHRLAKGELMRMKKLFIINMIILAASAFFTVVGVAADNGIALIGIFFLCFMIVTVIPAVALLFRDMTDKRVCDVMHSLPMTASQRFWSKIWALCEYHLIPTLVTAFVELFILQVRFGNDEVYLDNIFNNFGEMMRFYLIGVTCLFFTAAVTLLCQMCFGTIAETLYMSLIALTAFSVFPMLIYSNITMAAGFERMYNNVPMFFCLWTFTSVAGADGKVFSFIAGQEHTFPAWPVLIVNVLISVGVIYLCSRLYKKRTAETVGNPIAFRLFLEVLSVISVFVMFNFLDMADRIVAVVGSLVVFMVVHIILARGKNLKLIFAGRFLEFVGIIAAVLIVNAICLKTGGFGLAFSEPKGELEHCNIEIYFYEANRFDDGKYEPLYLDDVDKEKVMEITKILHSHFKAADRSNTTWRNYYKNDRVNFVVDERKENKNENSYSSDDRYYWDDVFDQSMCIDCDTETLYQELLDAGMKNHSIWSGDYGYEDEYVYYRF